MSKFCCSKTPMKIAQITTIVIVYGATAFTVSKFCCSKTPMKIAQITTIIHCLCFHCVQILLFKEIAQITTIVIVYGATVFTVSKFCCSKTPMKIAQITSIDCFYCPLLWNNSFHRVQCSKTPSKIAQITTISFLILAKGIFFWQLSS